MSLISHFLLVEATMAHNVTAPTNSDTYKEEYAKIKDGFYFCNKLISYNNILWRMYQ